MNETNILTAKKIKISGVVQGVGFRPFIYKLARQFGLVGEVSNSSFGVEIVVEGIQEDINTFIRNISYESPPLACINDILVNTISLIGFDNFSIIKSQVSGGNNIIIPPDISICDDCLNDIKNSENRRYRYPFTNCTNCGPRYTILKDIPYDRNKTSMMNFKMCSFCQAEYDNPYDRRFHAQPNACSKCGPSLCLTTSDGKSIKSEDHITEVLKLIKEGNIIAIKGIGGFHLVLDATNNIAVKRLRIKKHRKDKPLAIMVSNLSNVSLYAFVNEFEKKALNGIQKPIVLLKKIKNHLLSKEISPNNNYLGVMLPYTPLHHLLFDEDILALVMTSANLSGEPIIATNRNAVKYLGKIADYFLMHDRDIVTRIDDSVLKYYVGKTRIIRRSRGYVPLSIDLEYEHTTVLACGAENKNTICLTRGKKAFISQHMGNLDSKSSYNFFLDTIDRMQNIMKVRPEVVACDYHPDYMSSCYASGLHGIEVVKVQHHHAHIVSCLVENKIKNPVIGLAFDGTGLGEDNTIWGGEVLIADYFSYKRVACLEAIPMPGGSKAIHEPWRMAISYLYKSFGLALLEMPLTILTRISKHDVNTLISMIHHKINTPYTSSLGRLFDGVAAIIGICSKVSFEGQAAMELESLAISGVKGRYDFDIISNENLELIFVPLVKGIVTDVLAGVSEGIIASKFHNTIISMFVKICLLIKKNYGIKYVALSGGVFQNSILAYGIKHNLEKNNFKVLMHRLVPPNDGGISLGQAVIASHQI